MQNDFAPEYLNEIANMEGNIEGPINPFTAFPSFEMCSPMFDGVDVFGKARYGHYNSGIFYRFNSSPTSFDLDPFFFFADGLRLQDPKFINDFSSVVNDGRASKDLNLKKKLQVPTSVRPPLMRGPLVLSGWGYDVNGLPVPIDRGGTEEELPDTRNFDYFTAIDRRLWKTGPVDLRWDDERKVWTGGVEVVEGLMVGSLAPGDSKSPTFASGQLFRSTIPQKGGEWKWAGYTLNANTDAAIKPEPYGEPQDQNVGNLKEYIRIYNRSNTLSLNAGDYFAAIKINYEWKIISAGGGGSCTVGRFKRINCSASDIQKSAIPVPSIYINPLDKKWYLDFGQLKDKYIYALVLPEFIDLIPTESAGGNLIGSNGKFVIPTEENPYFITLVAFENCKYSSNIVTLKIGRINNLPVYEYFFERSLERLYDCPDSTDCFGTVTDDVTGAVYYAIHPFKFIKHNVRVIACGSNSKITCQGQQYSALLITEIDDCANAGTGESRE